MKTYVTDTHALLWHLVGSDRLSARVRSIFRQADVNESHIIVPTIVLVEIVYLIEKARIPDEIIEKLIELLETSASNYRLSPIRPATMRSMRTIPYAMIPDMPDRIIAATAKELGLPLITKDQKILSANVVTVIWE